MKKKFKMPSRAAIAKMNREHAIETVPVIAARIENLQLKMMRLRIRLDREVRSLVDFVNMIGGK